MATRSASSPQTSRSRSGSAPAGRGSRRSRRPRSSPATATPLLRSLKIENLVLIREAELDLAEGLNAITGETGAGKTILSQAIGLLLGAKGDAGAIGPGGGAADAADAGQPCA